MKGKSLLKNELLFDYLENINSLGYDDLVRLRNITDQHSKKLNVSSDQQLKLIGLMIDLIKPKKILEVGTFLGYATTYFANISPEDCKIYSIERDQDSFSQALNFVTSINKSHKIELINGDASDVLEQLTLEHKQFDLIYLDANKLSYLKHFELSAKLLTPKGLIIIDNVLWKGSVVKPETAIARHISLLNSKLYDSDEYDLTICSIADGIAIVKKL